MIALLVPAVAAALLTPPAAAAARDPAPGRAQAAQATTPGKAPAIAWAPCPQDPSADCGTLTVPVDRSRPGGPTTDLALARIKATDQNARIGSLLINPGGPGGSGVLFALAEARRFFSPEILRRFDVIGFDPRGVGASDPVVCSTELLARMPDPLMRSQADFDRWLDYNRRLREDCRARTGPVFDHVDSVSVARDMDDIRAAVGDEKLTYYGISYGTLIGQMYAETFPHRFRALALDSNMDHSLGTTGFIATESATVQDSFDEFAAWCRRDASCALHGRDVRAVFAGLLARAERGELRDPEHPDVVLTKLDVIARAFRDFYGPDWSVLARWLAAADAGTPTGAPAAASPAGSAQRSQEVTPFPVEVFCQDFRLPLRNYREYAAHVRLSERIAPDMRFSPLALSLTAMCLGRPAPIPNPQHRLRVDGTPPLLLANSLHDPATAYPWAVSSARQIGREARLLTYEGWGHGVYWQGECRAVFDAYLLSGAVPRPGARCPAVPPETRRATGVRPPLPVSPVPGLPGVPGWS
ncbi:alpha/beta hydrolase [Bailinhaonella thermotolerans]|uniref:Alpha/beta hydrolase n=2 Tax=Bailinhaonella thermotolerans TaxID=1070861 RepID=A0A3A4B4R6_9ACTN|nr:alpha/beta hydrolase [Bailinhaonella thermotolerans]